MVVCIFVQSRDRERSANLSSPVESRPTEQTSIRCPAFHLLISHVSEIANTSEALTNSVTIFLSIFKNSHILECTSISVAKLTSFRPRWLRGRSWRAGGGLPERCRSGKPAGEPRRCLSCSSFEPESEVTFRRSGSSFYTDFHRKRLFTCRNVTRYRMVNLQSFSYRRRERRHAGCSVARARPVRSCLCCLAKMDRKHRTDLRAPGSESVYT